MKYSNNLLYLFIFLVAGLASCASKYGAMSNNVIGYNYGYTESPIDSATWEVVFAGNSYTKANIVDKYALFRAAEITNEKGYSHFVVIDKSNEADKKTFQGAPMTHSSTTPWNDPFSTARGTVTTTTTHRDVYETTEHTSVKMIRMFKQDPGTQGSYNAQSVLKTMGPTIEREE